jgi:carbon monoxide dehydrogenase subunit G
MKIEGSYTINAPRETVWHALLDPAVLAKVIPGCEKLTATGENRYTAVVKAGVGAIKGTFTSEFNISDIEPLQGYTLTSRAKAPVGFVEGNGRVRLDGGSDGQPTTIAFTGEAKMGGALASVAARLFEAAAKKNTDEMFQNLRTLVEHRESA